MNLFRKISTFLKLWKDNKKLSTIKNSNLFDAEYYLQQHPEVTQKPHIHYFYYGWKSGFAPSPFFSTKKYLERYEDVTKKNINPLIHYIEEGKKENRVIEFDENTPTIAEWYQKKYQEEYDYKILYTNKKKKIQLFAESVSTELISFLNQFMKEDFFEINIINFKEDRKQLKELKLAISFINLKQNNYLECNTQDIFIVSSLKDIKCLLHNRTFSNHIFYYVESQSNEKERLELLNSKRVFILSNEKKVNFQKTILEYQLSELNYPESGIIYLDLDNLKQIGIEQLNQIFLKNILQEENWKVYMKDNLSYTFQLENHMIVKTTPAMPENTNFYWHEKGKRKTNRLELMIKEIETDKEEIMNIRKKETIQKILSIQKEQIIDIDENQQKLEELLKEG